MHRPGQPELALGAGMILRCKLDGLLLPAIAHPLRRTLVAFDGDEGFAMEAVEAIYYELVSATADEAIWLERAGFRLLRRASDFSFAGWRDSSRM